MLDLIGTTAIFAAIALNLYATVAALPLSPAQRLTTAGIAGVWIGFAIALAGTGIYAVTATPVPAIGVMAALPPVVIGLGALLFAGVRRALMALPVPLLVGLNIMRAFGVFFLLLAAGSRLSGPFPQSAGWGDVIVGLTAIPLVLALSRNPAGNRAPLLLWNLFGTLDLIAALSLGVMSAPGSPLQMLGGSIGSTAVVTLPWSNIPTILVPFYLLTHAIIFVRLAQSSPVSRQQLAAG
jgi:hypothetical protein